MNFEFAALSEAKNYRAALVKEFAPVLTGNVLEVGAGIGQITEVVRRQPGVQWVMSQSSAATLWPKPHLDCAGGRLAYR